MLASSFSREGSLLVSVTTQDAVLRGIMKDKPVREKKNLDKGLKRSVGKPACCVSKGGSSSNTTSLPNQLARDKGFEKRAQYYAAKAYLRQADKGDQYHNLKEIIFIAIADCVLFPNKSEYKSKHTIRDEDTNKHDLKDFYCIFIELPKFPKNKEEQLESIVDRWLFFFKYADETTEEDLRKIAEKAPIIKLAYDELDRFSWNEKDLIAYEERIMDLRKEEAILEYRLDLTEEKGIQIGEERGIKIGKEEGKIEVVKAMLANNVDVNTIVKFTGLSISEIEELSENL